MTRLGLVAKKERDVALLGPHNEFVPFPAQQSLLLIAGTDPPSCDLLAAIEQAEIGVNSRGV